MQRGKYCEATGTLKTPRRGEVSHLSLSMRSHLHMAIHCRNVSWHRCVPGPRSLIPVSRPPDPRPPSPVPRPKSATASERLKAGSESAPPASSGVNGAFSGNRRESGDSGGRRRDSSGRGSAGEPPKPSIKDFKVVEELGTGNFSTIVKVRLGSGREEEGFCALYSRTFDNELVQRRVLNSAPTVVLAR